MNVLAIGAHPDDIEYGCGGMLTKYAQRGHDVYLWVASDGALGGDAAVRRQEQQDSALIMGAREVFWGDYPDTEIPLNRELVVRIESVIKKIKPRMILVHYWDDTHQDHRNLAQGTMSATRYVPNFLFYEGPTTQNFTPNCFTDVEKVLAALPGLETPNLTGGIAKVLPNHHITKPVLIGEVKGDGQFNVVWKSTGAVPGDAKPR